jgi:aspartate ammonia-lyase
MPANTSRLPTEPGPVRIEHDLLGERAVPAAAYYGIQTARAPDATSADGNRYLRA